MALIRDYEIPGTGVVVPDAYHVITNVTTEKRLRDVPPPPDSSSETGYTERDDSDESQWYDWKAGYYGRIAIEVFASDQARRDGLEPIGAFGARPTDGPSSSSIDTKDPLASRGHDFKVIFNIDPNSNDSILTQAYTHLKNSTYYSLAREV